MKAAALLWLAFVSAVLSPGTAMLVANLFPAMAPETAGLIGGALTVPVLLTVFAVARGDLP